LAWLIAAFDGKATFGPIASKIEVPHRKYTLRSMNFRKNLYVCFWATKADLAAVFSDVYSSGQSRHRANG
jgi:hypothetical protein